MAKGFTCIGDGTLKDFRDRAFIDQDGTDHPLTRQQLEHMNEQQVMTALGWNTDVTAHVTYFDQNLLSIEIGYDSYCGGAHPEDGDASVVYDLKTGNAVPWQDLFTHFEQIKPRLMHIYAARYQTIRGTEDSDCITAVNEADIAYTSYYLLGPRLVSRVI